jgi:hypothetical protein
MILLVAVAIRFFYADRLILEIETLISMFQTGEIRRRC